MKKKKKVFDQRVPRPHPTATYDEIMSFLNGMPARALNLHEVKPDETKNFAKLNADSLNYVKDVVNAKTQQPNLILTHVSLNNIKDGKLAAEQFRDIATLLTSWAGAYTRNALQAESYTYQQSSIYESDVDTAIASSVTGAQMVKDTLVANREARIRKSVATRNANAKVEAKV